MRFIHALLLSTIDSLRNGCLIALLLFFAHVAAAQTDYPALYHQSYAQRHRLLDSVVEPAAKKLGDNGYLKQMERIRDQARSKKDRGLELAAHQSIYYFEEDNNRATTDGKIAQLNALLKTIDRDDYPEYAAWCLYEIANNYFGKRHNYTKAFDYYAQTIGLISALPSSEYPDKKDIFVNIANKYYRLGAYDQAKELLKSADTVAYHWPWQRRVDLNVKNTLGLISRVNGELDSAIHFFDAAYALALQNNDSTWMAIAAGNIGICRYMTKDYQAAVPLLYNDIKYSFTPGRRAIENGVNSLLILADIHVKMDSMESLGKDIALVHQFIDSCQDKVKPYSMLYPILGSYMFRLGKFREAAIAYDSATVYKDSLARRDNIYQLARMEHLQEVEKHNAALQQINAEKRITVLTRNALLTGVVLILIITVLMISRQRARHRIKTDALKARNDLAEQELKDATEKLKNYTLYLQEKNELIEGAGQEIQKLQATLNSKEHIEFNNDVLQKLYSSTILTDEAWTEFKALFEQVHKGYLQWLKDKIPDLTPSDTRFLVLNKLNLSNKEMAAILGIQADSVRSYKHRLKKRLDITGDTELNNLLGELLDKPSGGNHLN